MKKITTLIISLLLIGITMCGTFIHFTDNELITTIIKIASTCLVFIPSFLILFTSLRRITTLERVLIYIVAAVYISASLTFAYFMLFTDALGFNYFANNNHGAIGTYVALCAYGLSSLVMTIVNVKRNLDVDLILWSVIFAPITFIALICKTVYELIENIQDEELKTEVYVCLIFLICCPPLGLLFVWFVHRKVMIAKHPELEEYSKYEMFEGENGSMVEIDVVSGNGDDGHHYQISEDGTEAYADDDTL